MNDEPGQPVTPQRPDQGLPATPPPPPDTASELAATTARPSRARRIAFLAIAVLIVLLIAAGAVAFFVLRGTGDVLAKVAPSDSQFYVTAYLDPSAGQKINLKRAAGKFPALGNDVGQKVGDAVDRALQPFGLSFERDVDPWLGSQIAIAGRFGTNSSSGQPQFAVLIASQDDTSAAATLEKVRKGPLGSNATWSHRSYKGIDISYGSQGSGQPVLYSIVDHTVVLGDDLGFFQDVIDADQGNVGNLADNEVYRKTIGPLPNGVLGLAYGDLQSLVQAFLSGSFASGSASVSTPVAVPSPTPNPVGSSVSTTSYTDAGLAQATPSLPPGLDALQGFAISLSAQSDGMALDESVSIDSSKLTSAQRGVFSESGSTTDVGNVVPGDAYGFLAIGDVKPFFQSIQNQQILGADFQSLAREIDLQGALDNLSGEAMLELEPGTGTIPSGALVLQTNSPSDTRAFLDKLGAFLLQQATAGGANPSFQSETYQGVTIKFLPAPEFTLMGIEPAYAISDDMAILGSTVDAVKAVIDAQGGSHNLQSSSNIKATENYKAASSQVDPSGDFVLYVDIARAVSATRDAMAPDERAAFDQNVLPNLRPVKAFIASGSNGGDVIHARLFVVIR